MRLDSEQVYDALMGSGLYLKLGCDSLDDMLDRQPEVRIFADMLAAKVRMLDLKEPNAPEQLSLFD
jgi:hypothetical protein